ncbi:MAG: phosphatidate cytidylyltransferase [Clostridiales Family XIII bacterium]|jgi:phosphatidate cytidylyltransferase|nr:phosphatidate cytidylyltransferase [Clostridiales Family XIII bacterium]
MKTRVKSGLLMAPLLVVVWVGGYVLLAACACLSVFAVREFYRAFETATIGADRPIRPSFKVGTASVILMYALPLMIGDIGWAVVAVVMCFALLFLKDERSVTDSLVTMAGIFYVALFISCIYRIDFEFAPWAMGDGAFTERFFASEANPNFYIHGFRYNFVWLAVFSAFATDIFAYFTGRAFGKRKLAPVLSPKKTVAGGVGGLIGSAVVCGLFGYFAMPEFLVHCVVVGLLGSVAAQAGDLTASAIKRRLGVKDYSSLIPGHGGLLDRVDSLLFTAPFVLLYLSLIRFWTVGGDMRTPAFELIWQSMNGTIDASGTGLLGIGF